MPEIVLDPGGQCTLPDNSIVVFKGLLGPIQVVGFMGMADSLLFAGMVLSPFHRSRRSLLFDLLHEPFLAADDALRSCLISLRD